MTRALTVTASFEEMTHYEAPFDLPVSVPSDGDEDSNERPTEAPSEHRGLCVAPGFDALSD